MNYIWEIVLNAKENGILKQELFFKQAEIFSPYYEQSFSNLNQSKVTEKEIEINSIYRFDNIFKDLLNPNLEELEEFTKYMFDISIHFLCDVDLYQGITKCDIYLYKIKESILNGEYGEIRAETFKNISNNEKNIIALSLLKQIKIGTSLNIFKDIMMLIYSNMIIYQMKDQPKLILVYVSKAKTAFEEQKIELLIDLFMPIEFKIRIFWDKHFGVVSVDETMKLQEIELF